ncbi:MAG: alpha/beta hydrolase, partial [Cyanobacteria bacterium J06588_4]
MTTQTRLVPILGTDNASCIGDVVFVHGLGGDALSTWHPQGKKEKANSWLTWLGEDLEQVGIWTINYAAEP